MKTEQDEIVAYRLKNLKNENIAKEILKQYLIRNRLIKRNPNPCSINFAKGGAFFDVMVANGLIDEYYKPIYKSEVQ